MRVHRTGGAWTTPAARAHISVANADELLVGFTRRIHSLEMGTPVGRQPQDDHNTRPVELMGSQDCPSVLYLYRSVSP